MILNIHQDQHFHIFRFFDVYHLLCFWATDRRKMTCPLTYQQFGFPGRPGLGEMDISKNENDFVDTAAELDAARIEESVEIYGMLAAGEGTD